MKHARRLLNIIMCVTAICLLAACGRTDGTTEDGIVLYYVGNSLTKLESRGYEPKEKTADGQINEMISALSTTSDSLEYKAPFSFFTLIGLDYADRKLILDADSSYSELPTTTEILVRAAIVRSLSQIDGVDYVGFTVEGEQLYDVNGDPVGLMSADSFINNDGNEINTYELVKVKLYFANESGDMLIAAYREKHYSTNTPLERFVVDEIIAGPSGQVPGLYPTVNAETKVLSVSTRDGVCYVNLDAAFLTPPQGVSTELSIYSIVNSLAELSGINKVQILINGEVPAAFSSNIYERDLDNVTTLDQ